MGKTLTDEEAKHYFETIHSNTKLSMQELDNVAGGCGDDEPHDGLIRVSDSACENYERNQLTI